MDKVGILCATAAILLALYAGFLCASQTALEKMNRGKIKARASSGDMSAARVLNIDTEDIKYKTSILTSKVTVYVVMTVLLTLSFNNALPHGLWAVIATIISVLVITVLCELIPDAALSHNADTVAVNCVRLINFTRALFFPVSLIVYGFNLLLRKLFKSDIVETDTEDELIDVIDKAEEDGDIDQSESELIKSAIEFRDITAGEILTPTVDVVAVSAVATQDEIEKIFNDSEYSRLPVYGNGMDDIIGILHEKDFFYSDKGDNFDIRKLLTKTIYVSEHSSIAELFSTLNSSKCHMAIVVDEFGDTIGIVTMEDIVEELIGEIWDEHDEEFDAFLPQSDGSCLVDATAPLSELIEKFDFTPDESEQELSNTVNGWICSHFDSIPEQGDSFIEDKYKIEVEKADGKRVLTARIIVLEPEAANVGASETTE